MKIVTSILLLTFCLLSSALAANPKEFITEVYKEFYEKKDITHMNKYFSKQLSFQINLDAPVNYASLHEHLIKANQECVVLKMLPFDEILVVGNQVITLYTQRCTDKFSHVHKKRIMAITETDKNSKILKIKAVTYSK